jgi:Protein of unknown function (DUF4238)
MATYAKVKHSHIVPNFFLRLFADGEKIAMRLIGESTSKTIGVRDAGVRRDFYRRTRPSGEAIYDIEWSLSQAEATAAPVLKSLPSAWPLPLQTKAIVAQFVALQLVRGPRWHRFHEEFVPQALAEQRNKGLPGLTDVGTAVAGDEILSRVQEHLESDTERHVRMLSMYPKVATIFASMGWTLLKFPRPVLAVSDHPVVVWPLEGARKPQPHPHGAGLLDILEVRVPLSSTLALLMTWRESDEPQPVPGKRQYAGNLNAFTLAEAEQQWFHRPGTSPPISTGRLVPLSPLVYPDYSVEAARDSLLRAEVTRRLQPRMGKNLEQEVEVITVRRKSV